MSSWMSITVVFSVDDSLKLCQACGWWSLQRLSFLYVLMPHHTPCMNFWAGLRRRLGRRWKISAPGLRSYKEKGMLGGKASSSLKFTSKFVPEHISRKSKRLVQTVIAQRGVGTFSPFELLVWFQYHANEKERVLSPPPPPFFFFF